MSRPRFERFLRNLAHWCTYHNLPQPGSRNLAHWCTYHNLPQPIALEKRFDQAGKAGFGLLHASQLVGHAARLLY